MNRHRDPLNLLRRRKAVRPRPSGPAWLRVAVWALALVVLGGGVAASSVLTERQAAAERRLVHALSAAAASQAASPAAASASGRGALPTDAATEQGAVAPGGASRVSPGLGAAPGDGVTCTLYQTESNCVLTPAVGRPRDFLPAYRWSDIGIMNTDVDVGITHLGRIGDWALSWISQLVFSMASLVWRVILLMVNIGANSSWLEDSALVINRTITQLALPAMLFATVMWVVALAKGSKLALRGDMAGIVRAIVVFVLPLGLMITVVGGANRAMDAGRAKVIEVGGERCWNDQGTSAQCGKSWSEAGRAVVKSPMSATWLAYMVQDKSLMLSSIFSEGLTLGSGDSLSSGILGGAAGSESNPNCGAYLEAMFAQYHDASGGADPEADKARARELVYLHANMAWMSGMYLPWSSAAYGDSRLRGTAGCHELESSNSVPAALQQATMGRAYPGLITSIAVGGYRAAGNDSVYRTSTQPIRCGSARSALIGDRGENAKPKGNPSKLVAGASLPRAEKDPDRCLTTYIVSVAQQRETRAMEVGIAKGLLDGLQPIDAAKMATGPHAQGENGYSALADQGTGDVNSGGEARWRALDWAACTYLGNPYTRSEDTGVSRKTPDKWVVHPDWYNVGGSSPAAQDGVKDGDKLDAYSDARLVPSEDGRTVKAVDPAGGDAGLPASSYCTKRWELGHGVKLDLVGADVAQSAGAKLGLDDQFKTIKSDKFDNAPGAGRAYSNYVGQNSSNRLVYSVLTALGAYAYFRLVGVPALGLLLASIALVVLLCFLPLTLVLVAGGFDGGRKLGRMTVATAGSKALFLALMTFVIEVHFILSGLVNVVKLGGTTGTAVPVGASFANTVMLMCMPLGLLWVVDKTTEALGLGKLSSLKGGASFALNAATKAGNAGNLSAFAKGGSGGGGLSRSWSKAKAGAVRFGKQEWQTRADEKRTHRAMVKTRDAAQLAKDEAKYGIDAKTGRDLSEEEKKERAEKAEELEKAAQRADREWGTAKARRTRHEDTRNRVLKRAGYVAAGVGSVTGVGAVLAASAAAAGTLGVVASGTTLAAGAGAGYTGRRIVRAHAEKAERVDGRDRLQKAIEADQKAAEAAERAKSLATAMASEQKAAAGARSEEARVSSAQVQQRTLEVLESVQVALNSGSGGGAPSQLILPGDADFPRG